MAGLWVDVAKLTVNTVKSWKRAEENPINELLKPVDKLELGSDSDVSEISDVFEDLHLASFLRRQENGYLSNHEANVKTMALFTNDYKRTMRNLRKDLKIDNKKLLMDDLEEEVEDRVRRLEEADCIQDPDCKLVLGNGSEISSVATVESGFWNLLEAHSDPEKFAVSPLGFNAFRQTRRHWSQRQSISWDVLDESNKKCQKWLQEQTN